LGVYLLSSQRPCAAPRRVPRREIERAMSRFFVISIHMRVRTAEARGATAHVPERMDPLRPFRCAIQIEEEPV